MRALFITLLCSSTGLAAAATPPEADCRVGLYALPDRSLLDIGQSAGSTLRWRSVDGRTGVFATEGQETGLSTLGWTGKPDGHRITSLDCASGELSFDGKRGQRVSLQTQETRFGSAGVNLAGRLVLPPGRDPVPIVVLLHGAERDSALTFNSLQRLFPASGVGAFVYDKRGTGQSEGRYTQDYELLARDAVAAMHEARRLAGARAGRIGYQGPSQGGWVAPLAAKIESVDFVMVSFGLAVSVLEEDRSAVLLNLEAKGHGAQAKAEALEMADACAALLMRPTPEVFERFDAVRARHRGKPWFADMHGNFSFMLLPLKRDDLAAFARLVDFETPSHYDPMATIAALRVPQLWVLAQDDVDAPSAETARRLALLRMTGHPIATAMFPATDHGIYEYETQPNGERLSTRQPEGYLRLMVDFAKGQPLNPPYGTAMLATPFR
jgi:hypothetical protein